MSKGADAVLTTGQDRMDADVISRLPGSVRVIATLSVGFDHIDLIAAANRGKSHVKGEHRSKRNRT